jgi:hypothetical protein
MMRVVAGILGASFLFSLWIVLPPTSEWRLPSMSDPSDGTGVEVTRNAGIAAASHDGNVPFILSDGTSVEAATDHILQALGIIPEIADTALSPFEALVLDLLQQGLTDVEIDAAVNDAARRGDITVPVGLLMETGAVNTVELLRAIDEGSRAIIAE